MAKMAAGDDVTHAILGSSDSEKDFVCFDTVTHRDSESLNTISSVHTRHLSDFSSESETEIHSTAASAGLGVILRRLMKKFGWRILRNASARFFTTMSRLHVKLFHTFSVDFLRLQCCLKLIVLPPTALQIKTSDRMRVTENGLM